MTGELKTNNRRKFYCAQNQTVAIMARTPTNFITNSDCLTKEMNGLTKLGYVMYCMIPVEDGHTFDHLINYYILSAMQHAPEKQNNMRINSIFEFSATIDTNSAIILAGDFNDDVFHNQIINDATETRMWVQPRLTLTEHNPKNLLPTYSKHGNWDDVNNEAPSNLDTIIVTASLARTLVASEVHQPLRLSTHCVVSCEFAPSAFSTTYQTWMPHKPIPVERIKTLDENQLLQQY